MHSHSHTRAHIYSQTTCIPVSNCLSAEAIQQLTAALLAAGQDESVRVVVLDAQGPVFSAGHDLRELAPLSPGSVQPCAANIFNACASLMLKIRALPVPVIASVAGTILRASVKFWPCPYL